MMLMVGYGVSGSTHDFYAFDETGKVWNGSAFVSWVDGNYATYRIAATETGTSGRYTATAPTGTVRYELRYRGASLAASYIAWEETALLDAAISSLPASVWAYSTRTLTSFGTLVVDVAAAVWSDASRRLTMTASQAAAAIEGDHLEFVRFCTFSQTIEVGEDVSDADAVYFTLKKFRRDKDADALVQISRDGGLLVLDGEEASDASLGEIGINVTDESVTITIEAAALGELCERDGLVWDIKKIEGADALVVIDGTADVGTSVTRAYA